jgi:4-amino-4-deoxy-L-arabinose transferase-like glycosyltransferase
MNKILSSKSLNNKLIRLFILISIIVILVCCLYSSVLPSNDSYFYAIITKNIINNKDWINLTFNHTDWLDKPHLQFWITAVSYKIFGINVFSYIFPGLMFFIIGGIFTFKLAREIFSSKEVALLATLVYFTSLHLLISAIDIRQEAYLLTFITAACYYWYKYYYITGINLKLLFQGSIFTACAIMVKGIFVLSSIFGGIIFLMLYKKEIKSLISKKWIYAFCLSLVFTTPEIYSLFIQFDLHPEKFIFNQYHVSGIKWFFWGSQFGRFFNFGPINAEHKNLSHYFFYIHTYLWSFLPWSVIFIIALWDKIKSFRLSNDVLQTQTIKQNYIFLLGCFFPTFILFSLTDFQLDHYINILIPFSAIFCANWLYNKATRRFNHFVFYIQVSISFILVGIVIILTNILFNGIDFIILMTLCTIIILLFAILHHNYMLTKAILYPILSIYSVLCLIFAANSRLYIKYDLGYQLAQYIRINNLPSLELIDYKVNSLSTEFFFKSSYYRYDNIKNIINIKHDYYLITNEKYFQSIQNDVLHVCNLDKITKFDTIQQEKFIKTLFNLKYKEQNLQKILFLKCSWK